MTTVTVVATDWMIVATDCTVTDCMVVVQSGDDEAVLAIVGEGTGVGVVRGDAKLDEDCDALLVAVGLGSACCAGTVSTDTTVDTTVSVAGAGTCVTVTVSGVAVSGGAGAGEADAVGTEPSTLTTE